MKICILENDVLDPSVQETFGGFGAMFVRLLRQAGAEGEFEVFNTVRGEYPASYDGFDAVLLTGSRADSFSRCASASCAFDTFSRSSARSSSCVRART